MDGYWSNTSIYPYIALIRFALISFFSSKFVGSEGLCSDLTRRGKEKKPILTTGGNGKYKSYRIALWKDGKESRVAWHRLIALAWLPNPDGKPCINHKDEDALNNSLDNLEWCDHQYNIEYSLSKIYKLISPNGEQIEVFNLMKFCRENNLTVSTMYAVCAGRNKSHKGWKAA